ncbi:flagellar export protein FliJ [Humisphaera borealis]|uniref:Flagellar FliJ protein n=1 Tax=Humisphaera borealis TaxID=2807512 RepID=A0A7M2WWI8_9BACT|nr:flagellar export protein FliJ [Humisphaera borealis]QOV89908.1 flagellar export protein FliJ [Humisphaera borealis]
MAQFKFSLQAVLRQRELIEQDRQRALAAVQRVYNELEAELHRMDEAARAATQDLRDNHLIGSISVEYLAAHRRFTLAMQRKALNHAGRMSDVKKKVEAARAALIEAAKDRKAMEKLRDRRQEDWTEDQNRREAAATDEVAQQIGARMIRAASGHDADE